MKQNLLLKICAVFLSVSMILTSVAAVKIVKVYAEDDLGDYFEHEDEPFVEPYIDPDPADDPTPKPEDPKPEEPEHYNPDPSDYNLKCYTPRISFGTVFEDDYVDSKQFSIVNVGQTAFTLSWEEIDENTAFDIGYISPSLNMNPDEAVTFNIAPNPYLGPGSYVASYIFFSADDPSRSHTERVDVTVTVMASEPYISSIEVYPATVTIPVGKSYTFNADIMGGNGYDPSVSWALVGNSSAQTTIDGNGNLNVASNETSSSIAVLATSIQDTSFTDRAIVTVSSVDHIVSVKADPSEGGAVAGGGAVRSGGSCSVLASPNNNYIFKGWYEDGNVISNSGQFNVTNITSDRTLTARFERKSCYVKTSVNDTNGGSVTESGSVAYGGKYTITAKPNSGYSFAGFVENNKTISSASSIELNNITSDRNITAVFNRDQCNVNISVNPQDTGKVEGAGKYNKETKVEVKARAYDGYEFTGWSINGQIVSRDEKYTIDKIRNDINIVANFMKKNAITYKLTSGIANQGGSIVPSGDLVVAEGSSVTYNIVPQADYNISAVLVDGKNIGAASSYTFNNIKGGHTITASFEKKPVAAPTGNNSSGGSKKAVAPKTEAPKKTEYNETTAAEGAVPEQKVVNVTVPETVEGLEGDEYQEDVYTDATEITRPEDVHTVSSVMKRHDIDEDTLRMLISDDAVLPMLREAFEDGTLKVTVNNSYAEDKQETAAALYHQKPTLLNFEDVISETLTADEKFAILTGTPVSFNIDISENTDLVDARIKEQMQKKVGYKPVTYFDFLIMKSMGGETTVINKTAAELEVVVPIPEQFQKEGRKFFVIRNHNGEVDILQDIGDDPTTVTFRTDRFSEYAIAYESININKLILRFAIYIIVSLILALICFINLVKYKRRARIRAKR
ncbi:MAG: InlB B-repeat-containing protein [Butyrivibrio sp.]|nr:InlB B-repeat-containing protein [Butyrivibrio sp.]MBR1641115.1 InlB B-repeat-containing protein [Butyrivibrio sp.]